MPTVKNVSLAPFDLPSGRMLRPGAKADDVDLDDPTIAALLEQKALVEVTQAKPQTKPKKEQSS